MENHTLHSFPMKCYCNKSYINILRKNGQLLHTFVNTCITFVGHLATSCKYTRREWIELSIMKCEEFT